MTQIPNPTELQREPTYIENGVSPIVNPNQQPIVREKRKLQDQPAHQQKSTTG